MRYGRMKLHIDPVVVDKHALETWKTIKTGEGNRKIGISMADKALCNYSSIEQVHKELQKRFVGYPNIMKKLEKDISKKAIAISVAMDGFELGDQIQEFWPIKDSKTADKDEFIFQKLSENVQVTYCVENGHEYLAGFCYYPLVESEWQNRDKEQQMKEDMDAIEKAYKLAKIKNAPLLSESTKNPATTKPPTPDNIQVDLLIIQRILESGIGYPECLKMNIMPENTKIPLIHKDTKEALPEEKRPQIKDLVRFLIANPEWSLDVSLFNEMSIEPKVLSQVSRFLKDANDVETSTEQDSKSVETTPSVYLSSKEPVTKQPFKPEILKNTVDWKTWVSKSGRPMIGFTLAAENSEFSTQKCLKACRDKLGLWLRQYPECLPIPSLPKNTITVSFAHRNFKLGKTCQEFLPLDKFEVPDDAFYTYQMISKNVQATYYNEKGVEFLAGICWYLASDGKAQSWSLDIKLIDLIQYSGENFPLQDRKKSINMIKNNVYGRYCNTAGSRVAVYYNITDGSISHLGVNLNSNSLVYKPCKECKDEYSKYKWVESKKKNQTSTVSPKPSEATGSCSSSSETTVQPEDLSTAAKAFIKEYGKIASEQLARSNDNKQPASNIMKKEEPSSKDEPAPVTRRPFEPDTLKHTVNWKTWVSKSCRPMIGFTLAAEDSEFSTPECLEACRDKLGQWLINFPEFLPIPSLPKNTITVSFAHRNFKVGKTCQEFLPLDKFKIPDDAFYTYQMISKNVQATYYNEEGVEYLAGICWYLPSDGMSQSWSLDLKLIHVAQFSGEKFPLQDRKESINMIKSNIYGRYCKTAGRRVAVSYNANDGSIHHFGVNLYANAWEYTPCTECEDDYYKYRWLESKNENPTPIASPKTSKAVESSSNSSETTVKSEDLSTTSEVIETKTEEGSDSSRSTGFPAKEKPEPRVTEQSETASPTEEVVEIASDNSTSNSINDAESSEQPKVSEKVLSKAELLEKLVGPVTHNNPWYVMHERRMFFGRLIDICERNGEPINMVPKVSKQTIDLHRLYIGVRAKGGFLQVTMDKYWKNLCTEANPDLAESSAAGYQLRKHYQKHLLMLECRETGRNPEDELAFADKMKRQRKREPAGETRAAAQQGTDQRSQQGFPGSSGSPPSVPPGAYPENPTPIDAEKPSEIEDSSSSSLETTVQSEGLSTTTEIVKTEEKTEEGEDDSSEEKAKTRKGEEGSESTESEEKDSPTPIDSDKPSEAEDSSSSSLETTVQPEKLSTTTAVVKTEEKIEKGEDASTEEKVRTEEGEDGSRSIEPLEKEEPEPKVEAKTEGTSPTEKVVENALDKPTESDDNNHSTSNSINDAESSTTEEPEFLDTSSTASSDSFLEDYDQIENTENFTESDKEFDADVIY